MIGKSYDVRSWAQLMGRQSPRETKPFEGGDSVRLRPGGTGGLTNQPEGVSVDATGEAGRPESSPELLSQLEMFNA